MTENKLLNEFLDINKKPLDERGYFYDMYLDYRGVDIADDFAIGFAEWLNGLDINDEVLQKHISTKELLEIYKKGL